MILLTPEIEHLLIGSPIGSTDGKGMNSKVIVKYFNPYGAGTWLITEGEKQDNGDWLLFGYCHIFEWEWGYVMLSDLQDLETSIGVGIERDLYADGTVKELYEGMV